ncbi:unnamed protein product [Rotaria sordida]|uniref:DUF2059 domain-containing protein n=1 Tax=Rotaria sordida TaxID=392033 RepID=A0A814CGM4_9BILA|nr:unnamed protein product [Rotaria sordida]CAF1065395.1 unnamed protein product [Rotaria sordida]CAF3607864.1 unnamed protein product [Rotaria sordida]CAF3702175.1 unnamed protein product [Rotaria sordida]
MSIRLYILVIVIGFLAEIEGKPTLNGKLANRINVLLNITEAEKIYNNVLETNIISDPILSNYKSEIKSFVNKFFSFESLRPHIIEIYRDLYTLSDINGMIKFYSSPLGKKLLEKEPQAEIRLTQLIQNRLQENMPQIISWVQEKFFKNLPYDQDKKETRLIH